MRWIVALGLLAGCDQLFGLGTVSPGDQPFGHRKKITIVSPTSETLTDFPAAVVLLGDTDLKAGVLGGRDFRFTAVDGETPLPHELETYNATTGDLAAWVRIPALTGNTEIYLYYGGQPQPDEPATWRDEFGAVWHFSDHTEQLYDTTSHANALFAPSPAAAPEEIAGVVGNARNFVAMQDTLQANDAPSLDPGTGSFTYSVWVRVGTPAGQFDQPVHKGGGSATNPGYDFELGTGQWWAGISDGTTNDDAMFDATVDLLSRWIELTAVIDRSTNNLRVYVNAVLRDTQPLPAGSLTNPGPLSVSRAQTDDWYAGGLDELRLYHGALTERWIETEYRNIADPTRSLVVGPEENVQ